MRRYQPLDWPAIEGEDLNLVAVDDAAHRVVAVEQDRRVFNPVVDLNTLTPTDDDGVRRILKRPI